MRAEVPPRNRAERRAAMRHSAKKVTGAGVALTASTAAFAAALLAPGGLAGAAAETYTVDNNGDGAPVAAHCTDVTAGNCTLRDAIAAANGNVGVDTINFSVASPITLTMGQLEISDGVNIVGPGATALTISGNSNDRIFYLNDTGAFEVTISGLTLANGNVDSDGGAILNDSQHLTVVNSILADNTADDGDGGAIASQGTGNALTIIDSVITGNTAGDSDGGAIRALGSTSVVIRGGEFSGNTAYDDGGAFEFEEIVGPVSITDARILNNQALYGQGGALYTDDLEGALTLAGVTISSDNRSNGGGGAIAIFDSEADVTIVDSRISGNRSADAGGGIQSDDLEDGATFSIIASTISGNTAGAGGGGLYMGLFEGNLLVRNSTISGNTSADGGGGATLYFMYGAQQFFNSTISGNTAGGGGGAIYFIGYSTDLDLVQTTITGNIAAEFSGIYSSDFNDESVKDKSTGGNRDSNGDDVGVTAERKVHAAAEGGNINLVGTIVAKNIGGYDIGPGGTIVSTNSLIGTKATGVTLTDVGGTLLGLDPLLAPLADNGGPTQTHALTDASPAINAGPDPLPAFPGNADDQRGPSFPRVTNGRVDIGAYETPQAVVIIPKFTG